MQNEQPLIVKCYLGLFMFLAISFTSSQDFFFIEILAIYIYAWVEKRDSNKKVENYATEHLN